MPENVGTLPLLSLRPSLRKPLHSSGSRARSFFFPPQQLRLVPTSFSNAGAISFFLCSDEAEGFVLSVRDTSRAVFSLLFARYKTVIWSQSLIKKPRARPLFLGTSAALTLLSLDLKNVFSPFFSHQRRDVARTLALPYDVSIEIGQIFFPLGRHKELAGPPFLPPFPR